MLLPTEIGWGGYGGYEGPFYRGSCPYELPEKPTREDRIMAVITAAEGGHYDAINMYDSKVLSSGLIQWAEGGQFSVSAMLGRVHMVRGWEALLPLDEPLQAAKAVFKKTDRGPYRFFFVTEGGREIEIDTLDKQKQLFLSGSNQKGTWTPGRKTWAKTWAAAVARVWEDPWNQQVQVKFTADLLSRFVYPDAHQVFVNMNALGTDAYILEAAYAAYLSFAVNNPTIAQKHLLKFEEGAHGGVYTQAWLNGMLKELTYGPGIAIYPARYHAIKPVLEKLYTVGLFEGVGEISEWMEKHAIKPLSTKEAQELLIKAGYDLGPYGADGKYGPKTKAAICALQFSCGLPQTGLLDSKTCEWLHSVQHP